MFDRKQSYLVVKHIIEVLTIVCTLFMYYSISYKYSLIIDIRRPTNEINITSAFVELSKFLFELRKY